jgi:O-antigen ligase
MLVAPSRYLTIAILGLVFVCFVFVQALPLGFEIPFTLSNTGLDISLNTISLAPSATMIAGLRWASYAVFFVLCLEITQNRSHARRLAWIVFVVVGLHALAAIASFRLFGLAAYLGLDSEYPEAVTGTFINRNSFATFVGMGFVLGWTSLLRETSRRQTIGPRAAWILSPGTLRLAALWLLLLLTLAALLSTASRMGVAAALIGASAASILILKKSGTKKRPRLRRIALGGLGAGVLLLTAFGSVLLDRSIFVFAEAQTRLELYRIIMGMIVQRPLLGTGLDTFEIAIHHAYGPPLSPDLAWNRAHSTYLAHWSEMGLLFGSLPMLILCILAYRFMNDTRGVRQDYALSVAALAVILQTGVHSIVDFSLEMPANVYLFVLILALAFGRSVAQSSIKGS